MNMSFLTASKYLDQENLMNRIEWTWIIFAVCVSVYPRLQSTDNDNDDNSRQFMIAQAHLGSVYIERQHQCCDDTSSTTVIENNGVAPKWVGTLF